MAKAPYGPNGPYIGKFGASIGYLLNGQPIIRAFPHKSNKPLTLPRKNSCGKITLISNFLGNMTGFLKITFGAEARGTVKNWYNLAMQYNNPNAVKGYFPNLEMDYSKVILSRGSLRQPVNVQVERVENQVRFSWDVTDGDKWNSEQVMMMVYFPEDGATKFVTSGAKRIKGEDFVPVDQNQTDSPMETFITFVSDDRQDFSDSLYTGNLNAVATVYSEQQSKVMVTEKDEQHKILDMVRNFKNMGIAVADIVKATGLTIEEIERL